MTAKDLLKDFVLETSTHGIKRIFSTSLSEGSGNFGKSIVWSLAWLVASSYSIYQIHEVVTSYREYKRFLPSSGRWYI